MLAVRIFDHREEEDQVHGRAQKLPREKQVIDDVKGAVQEGRAGGGALGDLEAKPAADHEGAEQSNT